MQSPTIQGSRTCSSSGFTLIELVLVTVILGIIGMSSAFVVTEAMRVYARTAPALDMQYHLRLATERLRRDIRDMQGAGSITVLTPNALAFQRSSGEAVDYRLVGEDLTRNGDLLARGVTSFALRYWRSDGSAALLPTELRLVDAELIMFRGGVKDRLFTTVFPRTLGP